MKISKIQIKKHPKYFHPKLCQNNLTEKIDLSKQELW